MIDTLSVDNFKCFKKLRLSDLRRFNIIVGRNAGGKTALLEALFLLASANPQNVLTIRAFRGMGTEIQVGNERAGFEALWRDLFLGFDPTTTIEIVATGSEKNSRSLRVSYSDSENVTLPFGTHSTDTVVPTAAINFRWSRDDGEVLHIQSALTPQGLRVGPAAPPAFPAIFLTPVCREPASDNAQRFSDLSKVGHQQPIVDALTHACPFITDLSVELHAGIAMVHATLRSLAEKVPVPLISDGVNKLLSILLAIQGLAHGIVLIDEMEHGLSFDIMTHVSGSMLKCAKDAQTQIFVTTHSMEYLKALCPLVKSDPSEFCLLRTTQDNGSCDIDQFDGAHFAAALEEGFEIR